MTYSKLRVALVATLIGAASFTFLAPAAEARDLLCIEGEPGCPRPNLACVDPYGPAPVCVYDPCSTTSCWSLELSGVDCFAGAVLPAAGFSCTIGGKEYELIFCNYCAPFQPRTGVLCYVDNSGAVPYCVAWLPPLADISYDPPNVNCGAIVGPGPAAVGCNIEGQDYVVYTCQYCYPSFYVYCYAGTETEERCGTRGLDVILA